MSSEVEEQAVEVAKLNALKKPQKSSARPKSEC